MFYDSPLTFDQNTAREDIAFKNLNGCYRYEKPGLLLTVDQSHTPFETLIDRLIEELGTQDLQEKNITRALTKLLPTEILDIWPVDQLLPHFERHRHGYGDIEDLMQDTAVSEILINSTESVYFEKAGTFSQLARPLTVLRLERLMTKLIQKSGRTVNVKRPMVDFQLPTGERVNMILPPVSKKGPMISIRKFHTALNKLELLAQKADLPPEAIALLRSLAKTKKNIIVSGGTGSGKTTLLNALLGECPADERIIIVEDSSELKPHHPHWINLETRPPNQDASAVITMADLIKNTLRMRPTRVICGECRGPEAFQMLLAMNSGHPGSMTTLHANTPLEALYRLEVFLLMAGMDIPHRAIREFIATSIDVIIQLVADHSGNRSISHIVEIQMQPNADQYELTTLYEKRNCSPMLSS